LLLLLELRDAVVLGCVVPDALVLVADADDDVDVAVEFNGDIICNSQNQSAIVPIPVLILSN
jgi:hypothetical protein